MTTKRPILFATDGSASAAEAQVEAIELARVLDVPLVVVSVAHAALPPVGYAGYGYADLVAEMTKVERERVATLLESVAETVEAAGVPCSTVAAAGAAGAVIDEICRCASECNPQMLVVGSHGWGAARRLFSGSVSTGLVHSAPCPVLVVRPAGQAHHERAAAA